mmetsp:Transcript_52703/g.113845  ORF Transcript_52703/g.113845 Transcript_52703/m.113845 type:complete len:80 (-) Transcript_52703:7-246(-)
MLLVCRVTEQARPPWDRASPGGCCRQRRLEGRGNKAAAANWEVVFLQKIQRTALTTDCLLQSGLDSSARRCSEALEKLH